MKKAKKMLLVLGILIILFIGIMLLWWYYPVPRIDSNQFVPQTQSIEIHCFTDAAHPLRNTGITLVNTKLNRQLTGIKRTAVRFGLAKVFPQEFRIIFTKDTFENTTKIITLVDFGRGIKLVRQMQRQLTQQILSSSSVIEKPAGIYSVYYIMPSKVKGKTQPQACAWIDSGLVISNDVEQLTEMVAKYQTGNERSEGTKPPDCIFSVSNKNQELTELIKEQEKKFEYTIFPTVPQIDRIEGTLTMQNQDNGSGRMVFYLTKAVPVEKQAELIAEVEFLKKMLPRIVQAQEIELTATVTVQGEKVVMDYQVSGLTRIKL